MRIALLAVATLSAVMLHATAANPDTGTGAATVAPVRVIFHVGSSDKTAMKTAVWNVRNFMEHFEAEGRPAEAKIVVNGAAVDMLRTDRSPVIDMLEVMELEFPNVEYVACGISVEYFAEREGRAPPLFGPTKQIYSGVAYMAQLQSEGWGYIKP